MPQPPLRQPDSEVQVAHVERVVLDELAAGLHLVAHEEREDLVGLDGVRELHALHVALRGIHRRRVEFLGVHFAEALETIDAHALAAACVDGREQVREVRHVLRRAVLLQRRDLARLAEVVVHGEAHALQRGHLLAQEGGAVDLQPAERHLVRRMEHLHLGGGEVERRRHLLLEFRDARLERRLVLEVLERRRVAGTAHDHVARHEAVRVTAVQQLLRGEAAPRNGPHRRLDLGQEFQQPARRLLVERLAVRAPHGHVVEAEEEDARVHLAVRQHVLALLLALHLVERRLGEVDVAALDELGHLAVEERQQERADVRAVHVGIGHDDDLVVAGLRDVPFLREAAADGRDERADLVVREHAVDARLLDVQHLAAQGQDRLDRTVASGLGGTAGGIALHEEEFGLGGVAAGAVAQLARQGKAVHHTLAARVLAGLARRLAGAVGEQRFLDDRLRDGGVLLEVGEQLVADDARHDAIHLAVAELRLRLALELRLGHLHAHDHGQALAHVVAGELFLLLDELVVDAVLVDRGGERAAEARQVRAALHRVDVVAVRLLDRGVGVGVLHRHLGHDRVGAVEARDLLLALEVHDGGDRRLVRVQVRDELIDAALVVERLLVVALALVVLEVDLHAPVEEGELAQAVAEDLPLEGVAGEDRVVGEERHLRARLVAAFAHDRERLRDVAARELNVVDLAVALHLHLHPVGERVHARDAHAVEAARDLVVRAVELAARVEDGQHDLDGGAVLRRVHVHGNAAPVVRHAQRAVRVDLHVDERAVARQRLVDRVVHHLVHEMVVAALARVADVHGGALAHRLHPLQYLDVGGVVAPRLRRLRRRLVRRVLVHIRLFFGHVFPSKIVKRGLYHIARAHARQMVGRGMYNFRQLPSLFATCGGNYSSIVATESLIAFVIGHSLLSCGCLHG